MQEQLMMMPVVVASAVDEVPAPSPIRFKRICESCDRIELTGIGEMPAGWLERDAMLYCAGCEMRRVVRP